jgi:hypothetical protein
MSRVNVAQVRRQVWLIIAAVVALYGLLRLSLGPLPQDPSFHLFADTRTCLSIIPRAGDVLTNLAILAAGLFGLALRARMTISPEERTAVNVLIAASILTAFGSAFYHWAPTNETLVWDRLPLAVILMSVFALVLADRVHPLLARHAIWPLTALGIVSVIVWGVLESMGKGDLLLYLVVRVGTVLAIVMLLILRQPRHTETRWLVMAVLCEIIMATFERLDHEVFRLTGGVASGHNLKHVMVGVALGCVFWWLRVRRVLPAATDEAQAIARGQRGLSATGR